MNTRQRIVLIVGITIVAWLLHILFVDWSFDAYNGSRSTIFVLAEDSHGFGLMIEPASDRNAGVLFGLILPPTLLVWGVFLLAGLRDHRRREQGLCPKCGYGLRFDYSQGCSECGWRRDKPSDAQTGPGVSARVFPLKDHRPRKPSPCPACGYDLTGHLHHETTKCPECGSPVVRGDVLRQHHEGGRAGPGR